MGEQALDVPGELRPASCFGHLSEAAIRKVNTPGWTPFRSERVGADFVLTGGIEGKYRNGRPKWAKPFSRVVITRSELDAEERRYEREHDRCRVCLGRGQEIIGWSKADGSRYEPCRRCNATGRPKAASAPASAPAQEGGDRG